MEEVVSLLFQLKAATKIYRDYMTASMAIPLVRKLIEKIKNISPSTPCRVKFEDTLLAQAKKRLENIEAVPLLAVATLLNPRFKTQESFDIRTE